MFPTPSFVGFCCRQYHGLKVMRTSDCQLLPSVSTYRRATLLIDHELRFASGGQLHDTPDAATRKESYHQTLSASAELLNYTDEILAAY